MTTITIEIVNSKPVIKTYIDDKVYYIDRLEELTSICVKYNYRVYLLNNDMVLKGDTFKIEITGYKDVLSKEEFYKLSEDINKKIKINGFSDLSKKRGNLERTNKYVKTRVVSFTLAVLLSSMPLGTVSFKYRDNINDEPLITDLIEDDVVLNNLEISEEEPEKTSGLVLLDEVMEVDDIIDEESKNEVNGVPLNLEDLSNTEKAEFTRNNYLDYISKYATLYGLDEKIVLGMATQERGEHSSEIDAGGGIGLMQVQYSVWVNQNIECYELNDTGQYEKKTVQITDEMLRDVETNIRVGCMILQNCLIYTDYNIPLAIEMYNKGYNAMLGIVSLYASSKGTSKEDVIANQDDIGWLDFCEHEYLTNVCKWISNHDFKVINVKTGEEVTFSIVNSNELERIPEL